MTATGTRKFKHFNNLGDSGDDRVAELHDQVAAHPEFHFIKSSTLYLSLLTGDHYIDFRNPDQRKQRHQHQVEALHKMLFILNTITEMREL